MMITILSAIGMIVLNVIFESVVFIKINLFGIRPDTVIAVVIAVALTGGSKQGALYGAFCGAAIDVLFSRYIGMYTLPYMIIGALAGIYYNKYYADNKLFPVLLALPAYVLKEFIMGVQLSIAGVDFSFFHALWRYELPSAVLTAALTAAVYVFLRRQRSEQIRRARLERSI